MREVEGRLDAALASDSPERLSDKAAVERLGKTVEVEMVAELCSAMQRDGTFRSFGMSVLFCFQWSIMYVDSGNGDDR